MSRLSDLLAIDAAGPSATPAIPAPTPRPSANSMDNFFEALAAAQRAQNDVSPAASLGLASNPAVTQERSRMLQSNGDQPGASNGGDAVLSGLQKLRSVFDSAISTFSITSAASGTTEGLYRAQVAATNFSIFIDLASKLAGKGDQAFNSLLKGQ